MRQFTALAIAAALALAACSGGDDEATPTTAADPATTAATTTTAAPSTQPPPTEAPTTTPPPTTPAPTTAPPTTAPRDIVAEVTQAALAYDAWYVECLRNPPACDPSIVAVEGSDAFNALTRTRDELISAGFYVGQEDRGYTIVESVEVMSDHVLATVCGYTTLILYGPPGLDGQPTVQNDTAGTVRENWQFVESDGRWMFTRGDILSQESEVNTCPPEA